MIIGLRNLAKASAAQKNYLVMNTNKYLRSDVVMLLIINMQTYFFQKKMNLIPLTQVFLLLFGGLSLL